MARRRSSWGNRAARAVILIVPAALVAFQGATYLFDTAQTLLAPGAGIELAYATPRGIVRITAKTYAVDPVGGLARLEGLRVVSPEGRLLASVNRARIEGLDLANGLRPKVVLEGPRLAVSRGRKGEIDLAEYLPKQEGPPSDMPYEVEIVRGRLDVRDYAARNAPLYVVQLPRARVAGRSGDLTGNGEVTLAGVGGATVALFRNAAGVTNVRGEAPDLDAARVLEILRAGPERQYVASLDGATVRSLRASGSFTVDLAPKQRTRFRGDLVAQASGIAYRQEQIAEARFRGVVTDRGAQGRLDARDGVDRVAFAGTAFYADAKRPSLGGTLDAALASSDRLRKYLPADLKAAVAFRGGRFHGAVAYADAKPAVQGSLQVATARYGAEVVRGASAALAFSGDQLDVRGLAGTVRGANLSGAAAIGTRDRTLLAFAEVPELSDRLARPYVALPGLQLSGGASLLARGTFDAPRVEGRADVRGSYRLPNGTRLDFAPQTLDLALGKQGMDIGRVALTGRYGTFVATGGTTAQGELDVSLSAKGVDLRQFDPQARGRADLVGRVRGKLADPRFAGRVEGYGVGTQDFAISAVGADLLADKRRVAVTGLTALKGAGKVEGSARLALGRSPFLANPISGQLSARGLQISDFAGESAVGRVDVNDLVVGGTLQNPVARGEIRGRRIVAGDIRIPRATARLAIDKTGANVAGATAEVAGGNVTGGARYTFADRSGSFSGEFQNLRPETVLAQTMPQAQLVGTLDGQFAGALRNGRLSAARVQATADELTLNRVALGSGMLSASYAEGRWRADTEVGQLARFIAARGLTYDPETGVIGGRVEALGIPIPEVVAGAAPALREASPEVRGRLASLNGSVALGAELSGTARAPVVEVESLAASNLALAGTAYGDLNLAGTYANGSVVVKNARLEGPNGTVTAGGVVGRDGTLDLRVDANNLAAELLRPFAPGVAGYDARIESGSFEVGGTLDAPEARGSLLGYAMLPQAFRAFEPRPTPTEANAEAAAAPPEAGRLNANLFDIRLSPGADGTLNLGTRGLFSVVGFTGDISADVPVNGRPEAPISAELVLRPRKLSEVAAYFPGLRVSGETDEVGGTLRVGGTLGTPTASGRLSAKAGEIAYQGITTTLQNPIVEIGLDERRVTLDASTTSSYGGRLQANLATNIADLLGGEPLADPLARTVAGTVSLDRLRVFQRFPDGGDVDARATTTAPLAIAGTLRTPRISGAVSIGKLDTTIPTLATGEGAGAGLPIDPVFDIAASIEESARIRSSVAQFELGGGGTVQGPLSRIRANADLVLQAGTLRLPGGTVRLDPGGTLDFSYAAAGPDAPLDRSAARLETALTGRTSITALADGVNSERYDITIDVRGDLLSPNGLNLNARSDPPDLTQERILTGFLDTGNRRRLESELRTALTGVALPNIFGGFTNQLARDFGFDYLTLDYNAFEQASIVFARSLGPGLTFSGRRQLSAPQPGFPQRYDLRLAYRPRRGAGYLKDLSFSIGADDERPYKVSLEYGIRFGNPNPPLRIYRLGVKDDGGR